MQGRVIPSPVDPMKIIFQDQIKSKVVFMKTNHLWLRNHHHGSWAGLETTKTHLQGGGSYPNKVT